MLFETMDAFKKGECRTLWYCCLNMIWVGVVFCYATIPEKVLFIVKQMFTMFFSDLKQKSTLMKEKQHDISDLITEINQKETQKENIMVKIQNLRDEQAKRQAGTFIFWLLKLDFP